MTHALAHFLGGFVSKRDSHDGGSRDAVALHQVRDSMGDHAGFSAAGAGQQQQRSFDVRNSRLLFGIQALEKVHYKGGSNNDFSMLMIKELLIGLRPSLGQAGGLSHGYKPL